MGYPDLADDVFDGVEVTDKWKAVSTYFADFA